MENNFLLFERKQKRSKNIIWKLNNLSKLKKKCLKVSKISDLFVNMVNFNSIKKNLKNNKSQHMIETIRILKKIINSKFVSIIQNLKKYHFPKRLLICKES